MSYWVLEDTSTNRYVAETQDHVHWQFTTVRADAKRFDTEQDALLYKEDAHGDPPVQFAPVEYQK